MKKLEVELIVLRVKNLGIRCFYVKSRKPVTLKPKKNMQENVPGEIITVKVEKSWSFSGHDYLSGEIVSSCISIKKLKLRPLKLFPHGQWIPKENTCGLSKKEFHPQIVKVFKKGTRDLFEMEQVLPGINFNDNESDPIIEASDLFRQGEIDLAYDKIENILKDDLRCLDCYSHMGNWLFNQENKNEWNILKAKKLYKIGVKIGILTLGKDFNGVLSWGLLDNRPFLRCMGGYGLCLWWLKDFIKAKKVFKKMLLLNPSDNQGIRFLLDEISVGNEWNDGQS